MTALAFLALLALTVAWALVPLVPALREWRYKTDVAPLPIDQRDALEPDYMARRFMARFEGALQSGARHLGLQEIGRAETAWGLPLSAAEMRRGATARVWHARGDLMLPRDVQFGAEVVSTARLHTAAGGRYPALWAGARLALGAGTRVQQWAHGHDVAVAPGCVLAGRVSADEAITFESQARFTLLHAPLIRFGEVAPGDVPLAFGAQWKPLPAQVQWDEATRRGTCHEPLSIQPGHRWRGDLVCHSHLALGGVCVVDGNIKSHADIHVGWACTVRGSIVAQGRIEIEAGCTVLGPVVSETEVVLGEGCTVGAPGRLATVAAPRITVGAGCVVHGTLWAGESGRVCAPVAAQVPANAPTPAPAPAVAPRRAALPARAYAR